MFIINIDQLYWVIIRKTWCRTCYKATQRIEGKGVPNLDENCQSALKII